MATTRALADVLAGHQIAVYELTKGVRNGNAHFNPGTAYIVPVEQVQYRLITSLFERRTVFEDSLFYDVSSWSLPLAFGLNFTELNSRPDGILGPVRKPGETPAIAPLPANAPIYAFEWSEFYAPRALLQLFDEGVIPRMAFEGFTAGTASGPRSFSPGTVVIHVGAQSKSNEMIREILKGISERDGISVAGITTGLTSSGIDLGSPKVIPLERPSVGLVTGSGVSASDAGEVWHLLDRRYGMTVTLVDQSLISASTLGEFNVLILPSGRYSGVGKQQTSELTKWVETGNTLIVLEQAAEWAIGSKLSSASMRKATNHRGDTTIPILYSQEEEVRGARNVPGSIVSAWADLTHPLLFGLRRNDMVLFKSSPVVFESSHRTSHTPVSYTGTPLVGGYLHKEFLSTLSRGGAIAVSRLGRGKVILMADDPVFRAFWFGTSRLLSNGVFLGRYIDVPPENE
jgi:hypothetical protein